MQPDLPKRFRYKTKSKADIVKHMISLKPQDNSVKSALSFSNYQNKIIKAKNVKKKLEPVVRKSEIEGRIFSKMEEKRRQISGLGRQSEFRTTEAGDAETKRAKSSNAPIVGSLSHLNFKNEEEVHVRDISRQNYYNKTRKEAFDKSSRNLKIMYDKKRLAS